MKILPDDLPNDIDSLKALLLEQSLLLGEKDSALAVKDNQLAEWASKYERILEQWRLAQQKQFGKGSEVSPGQGELFDESENDSQEDSADVETDSQTVSYTRTKPKRKPLPKDLPRETVVVDVTESDKTCACCQTPLHRIGEDTSEKLEFLPAQLKVIETVRPKYACRQCEKSEVTTTIKQASIPPSIIPKGIATPSLLSQVITGKFQYSLPLYRQEAMFKQYGIELSRQTMSDWMLKCSSALQPLYDRLHTILLEQSVIQADETTLNVIKEARSSCYMWLYCTGKDGPDKQSPIPNIVLYDFQPTRSAQCAIDFLQGFDGYLNVDGYQAYESTNATLAGCWAHARRKFIEAEKGMPKGKSGKATVAINHIKKLYAIEVLAKQQGTTEEVLQMRQEKAPAILATYKAWLEKSAQQVPPKTLLGKAIQYNLNQWNKLTVYLTDGQINIDNNRAERAIKPFVIGRKNWLFANTGKGAISSAILYSAIETAKANGLIPYDYLVKLFEELPKRQSTVGLDDLLPWNIKHI
ncbi:transposase [Marinomonas primoryensis]|uniref:Transposase n=1 Tax=Marinomonas primoryensis TaxID=178399 RepID=A0A2Z4PTK0_9GAMM|nr:IS66 family transposase [Marinomonas primoryensis]AWX99279.1 transposase [Marinomonas primoryensis]AWX99876.1 transposase [Marinomonas primoryensis]AWY00477.1 transposase [Marinomonas primoryensis]AWY00912.1 transposase [Marinomonas primoryensis]AWY01459.1 transposase [Marinomonas primoryensis]